MEQIFISYVHAGESRELAEKLGEELRRQGFHPWMDAEDLKPGANFMREIERAMKAAQACVLLLESGLPPSKKVQEEQREALEQFWERDLPLIPVRIRGAEVPSFLMGQVAVEVWDQGDWEQAVRRVVEALQNIHTDKPFRDESALAKARSQQEERLSYIEQSADSLESGSQPRE